MMLRVWAFVIAVLAVLGFAAWASDFVTMQGERMVYTVDCVHGAWQADRCNGQLTAGVRYRYPALKPHGEGHLLDGRLVKALGASSPIA